MRWSVETHAAADDEILALPPKLQARLLRLVEMVENVGLGQIHDPHVKHLDGKLWELRAKAPEGIYVAVTGRVLLCCMCLRRRRRKHPKRPWSWLVKG
jgi:hypothetical protein